ncbi:MAG TPA: enoyl-CoA hydratase/isomerase family protein [Thermoanaerobaculia bacterium]|nr:enoyl-CoA hydratase/isomerase family protein [Thermoanaerobaculia bacterium]
MIEIVERGAVRELRLARPPANALSPELMAALTAALAQAAAEAAEPVPASAPAAAASGRRVAALVLSGAPGMFSAGLDVPYLLTLDRAGIRVMWNNLYALLRTLAASPLPVVAAITGHSPAGGAVLALHCDARVMADGDFRIGLNEVRVGLPLPPVIFAAMRRLVGPRQAERMCVSGALVLPAEAARIGLVDEVVPADQAVERAAAIAAELAALPRAAMTATRRLARADLVAMYDDAGDQHAAAGRAAEIESVLDSWFSVEAQATMRSLVERLARKRAAAG